MKRLASFFLIEDATALVFKVLTSAGMEIWPLETLLNSPGLWSLLKNRRDRYLSELIKNIFIRVPKMCNQSLMGLTQHENERIHFPVNEPFKTYTLTQHSYAQHEGVHPIRHDTSPTSGRACWWHHFLGLGLLTLHLWLEKKQIGQSLLK